MHTRGLILLARALLCAATLKKNLVKSASPHVDFPVAVQFFPKLHCHPFAYLYKSFVEDYHILDRYTFLILKSTLVNSLEIFCILLVLWTIFLNLKKKIFFTYCNLDVMAITILVIWAMPSIYSHNILGSCYNYYCIHQSNLL